MSDTTNANESIFCPSCGSLISADSEYCPFCNFQIEHEAETEEAEIKHGNAGKKFKLPKLTIGIEGKKGLIIGLPVLLFGILGGLCISQHSKIKTLESAIDVVQVEADAKIEQMEAQVEDLNRLIEEKQSTLDVLNDQYEALTVDYDEKCDDYNELAEKMRFFDSYVVVVGKDMKYYHHYGCEKLDSSTFYAFNVNYAKSQGYTACSTCISDET